VKSNLRRYQELSRGSCTPGLDLRLFQSYTNIRYSNQFLPALIYLNLILALGLGVGGDAVHPPDLQRKSGAFTQN
jgi:hypothetical protein